MRAMDEFGSVLTMAALLPGSCAAADWISLVPAVDGVRPVQADAEGGRPGFVAVVHRDRVVLADRSRPRQVVAAPVADSDGGAPAAPTPLAQQTGLSL